MDYADDIAAIHAVIADIETGFNTDDAERSVAHFTDDATAVSAAGVLAAARAALLAAHRAGDGQRARYSLGEVTFLRPGVAVAHKRARALGADGAPLELDHTLIALYVFVRDGGRWRVAARQDTLART